MTLARFLFVGLVAGWVMGMVRHGHGYGFFGNVAVGVLGSFIGWFLMGFLRIPTPTLFAQIAMAVAGAVVFFLLMGSFKWKRRKTSPKEGGE